MTRSSCLYVGHVWHRREHPVTHGFRYRIFMVYADLVELSDAVAPGWLWSTTRPALAWLRRADHLGDPRQPLDLAVRDLVAERRGWRPGGPIRLLTHPRFLGVGFNPISIYYCHEDAEAPPAAAVLEVTNTPWGERHCYVLDLRGLDWCGDGIVHGTLRKAMHVSPFLPMGLAYHWRLQRPAETLRFGLDCSDGVRTRVCAGLLMERRELTPATLRQVLLRHAPMPAVVLGGIYWQALRMWWKRVPYHRHPRRATARVD